MAQYQFPLNSYAGDGRCHSAPRGTFGHECGKPATSLGTNAMAFRTGFCADCIAAGIETAGFTFEYIASRETDDSYAYITTRAFRIAA